MNQLPIGQVIKNLRKEKGLTQEQLADNMNVSCAAVSKWESGISYPDIVMLPKLATFFGTSIDFLLTFKPNLSQEEEAEISAKFEMLLLEGDSVKISDFFDKYSKEYPGNYRLNFRLASQLKMMQIQSKDSETKKKMEARIINTFSDIVTNCSDGKLVEGAIVQLATSYTVKEDYETALTWLKKLPAQTVDTTTLKATILINQGNIKEARAMLQRQLLKQLSEIDATITSFAHSFYEENLNAAEKYMTLAIHLRNLFDENQLTLFNAYLSLLKFYAYHQDSEKSIAILRKITALFQNDSGEEESRPWYLDEVKSHLPETVPENLRKLFRAYLDNQEFAFLRDNDEFRKITDENFEN